MDIGCILSKCDHTVLSPAAVWSDIKAACEDALAFHTASVCIPASFVKRAKETCGSALTVCTVIGFPTGYSTTAAKCFEAADAANNGADEIDMVLNIGWLKEGNSVDRLAEINAVKSASGGRLLKVIIETCLLTEEEKKRACGIVSLSDADYIKTSTGFSSGGATREDVALLRRYLAPEKKVKAAGGIASLEDAAAFLALGADRLGTSRLVKIAKAAME
jgi:deoxyribose-phosphate aldolase